MFRASAAPPAAEDPPAAGTHTIPTLVRPATSAPRGGKLDLRPPPAMMMGLQPLLLAPGTPPAPLQPDPLGTPALPARHPAGGQPPRPRGVPQGADSRGTRLPEGAHARRVRCRPQQDHCAAFRARCARIGMARRSHGTDAHRRPRRRGPQARAADPRGGHKAYHLRAGEELTPPRCGGTGLSRKRREALAQAVFQRPARPGRACTRGTRGRPPPDRAAPGATSSRARRTCRGPARRPSGSRRPP